MNLTPIRHFVESGKKHYAATFSRFKSCSNWFSFFLLLICSIAITTSITVSFPAIAKLQTFQTSQQTSQTLQSAWGFSSGFTFFHWLRAEDKGKVYSSTVHILVKNNKLSIFNAYQREPLGQLARCGGLGCDLGKGSLIATLKFLRQGDRFIIKTTSSKATFLKGASCKVDKTGLSSLECLSDEGPQGKFPSLFKFLSGS